MKKPGMLWFDNTPGRALTVKVQQAAEYYRAKYGQAPNLALVNPADLPADLQAPAGLEVQGRAYIIRNHVLVSVEVSGGQS